MLQTTLATSRLRFVPLSDDHLGDEAALEADPAVMRFVGAGRPRTPAEVATSHSERLRRAADGLGFWAAFQDDSFVGWWFLAQTKADDRGDAELGYRLHQRFWGQGLATEGAKALLEHGFSNLGLANIFAVALSVNRGSRRVLERLGFRLIDTRASSVAGVIDGAEDGEVDYVIAWEDWLAPTL